MGEGKRGVINEIELNELKKRAIIYVILKGFEDVLNKKALKKWGW